MTDLALGLGPRDQCVFGVSDGRNTTSVGGAPFLAFPLAAVMVVVEGPSPFSSFFLLPLVVSEVPSASWASRSSGGSESVLEAELSGLKGGELSSYALAPSSLTFGSESLSFCLDEVEALARDFPRVLIRVIDVFGLALDPRARSGEETRLSTLEMEGLFRTLSQKCSYGRMTRV